jgi:Domain of unknown function (DUF4124)
MKKALCMLVMLVTAGLTAHAATYRWVDSRGNVNFTDDPESIPPEFRKKVETRKDITTKDPEVRASVENDAKRAQALRDEAMKKARDRERKEAEEAKLIRLARLEEKKELEKEKEKERKAGKRRKPTTKRYVWVKK